MRPTRPTNVKSSVSLGVPTWGARVVGALLGLVGGLFSLAAGLTDQYIDAGFWWGAVLSCLCSIFGVLTLRTHRLFAPIALVLSAAFGMVFSAPRVSAVLLVSLAGGALALFACFSKQEANQDHDGIG
jgi:hypothetical protein